VTCDRLFDDEPGPRPAHPADPRQRHLAVCPRCRRRSRALAAARAEMRALPRIEPSPDFLPRLEARIGAIEAGRVRRRRLAVVIGRAGSGFALMAAAVAALWLRAAGEGPEPAPASALAALGRDGGAPLGPAAPSFDPAPAGGPSGAEAFEKAGDGGPELGPALDWSLLLASATPGSLPRSFGFPPAGARAAALQPVLYAAPSLTFAAAPVSLRFASAVPRPARPGE
jgi:hypothetical protein